MTQSEAGRILVVDDDVASGRLQQRRLQRVGHTVDVCDDIATARTVIQQDAIDLMLLDQQLAGGASGLEFYRQLQRDNLVVPSILVTGWPDDALVIEALRAGFRDFVTKSPAYIEYLPDAVARVLAQVRVERRLAESEELHRVTLSNVSDTVLLTDESGRFTYVCPNVEVNFGYSVEEVWALGGIDALLGKSLFDEKALLRETELRNIECEVPIRDGELSYFLVNVKRVSIQAGTTLYSIRNITERRQLQVQRDRIFSDSLSLLGMLGFDGYYKRVNPSWEKVFGFTVDELLSAPFMSFIHPEDVPAALAETEKLAAGGQTVSFELRARCKDGSYRWILWNATPFLDQQVFYATGHDITERKEAEERLTERIRLAQLSADVGRALISTTTTTEMLQACAEIVVKHLDAAFARVWVLNESEQVLQLRASAGMYTHLDGDHSRIPVGAFKIGLIAQERQPHLTNNVCNDPRVSNKEWARREGMAAFAGYPLMLGDRLLGVLGMFSRTALSDATLDALKSIMDQLALGIDRKRTEASLRETEGRYRQAQKMEAVGLLAGGIAHDFNNLLTIILGFAECLCDEAPAEGESRDLAEEIYNAAQRAAALTHQLLAFSRRQVLAPVVLDLNELVDNTLRLLRRVIGEDIQLSVRLDDDLRRVHADPAQLEQILMNLAVNARDAMPSGGTLIIETQNTQLSEEYAAQREDVSPGDYVLLAVSDTGCGMDAATQARAFEPFFTTKEQGKGTGMGLSTVYGIVKQTGGHVALYSEPGHGTTFKVYLPCIAEEKTKAGARMNDSLPMGDETILLVEDEEGVRRLAQRILQKHGYNVLEADCGDAALKIATGDTHIDLLLTDVVMPGMSGKQLVELLAEVRPEMPAMYMSGYTGEVVAHHGVLEKGAILLQKPFTQASLTQKVREVLNAHAIALRSR